MTQLEPRQLLQQGVEHHRAGRIKEAEVIYRHLLQQNPQNVEALSMLGVLAGQTNHLEDAVAFLGRAVSLRPNDVALYHNLATALRQAGKHNDAIEVYKRALTIAEDPMLLVHLGNLFWLIGNGNDAETSLLRALKLDPDSVPALHGLGSIYLQLGFYDRSADALKRAVALQPKLAQAHRDLGVALYQLNWFPESADACRKALEISPSDIVALNHLGMCLQKLGKGDQAVDYLNRVANAPAVQDDEWFNRGLAMSNLYRIEEAEQAYLKTLELKPTSIPARLNLGVMQGLQGKTKEALASFEQVMKAAPNFETGLLHHGVGLLLAGQFRQGWKEYQSRWNVPSHHEPLRPLTEPLWREQSVRGKTVLIFREQGFGDTLQFCRYAPLVKQRGARVILEVQPELVTLLKTLEGADEVIPYGQPLPRFDLQVPLLDLAMLFNTTLENIPAKVPYLKANPEKARTWARRLEEREKGNRPKLRVGIAWAGSHTHPHDRGRSIALEDWAPIGRAGADRVSFVSLQKGARSEQAANPPEGMSLFDSTADLKDFDDTAALLMNLDLIISVDTSIVHLAGALGKETWVLIPVGPDWRWLEHREDTPWYPTHRLFRQKSLRAWPEVIERVAAALTEKLDK